MKKKIYNILPELLQPFANKAHGIYQNTVNRAYGIYLHGKNPEKYKKKRDPFEDIRNIVNIESPVIVDGGAHVGKSVDTFLKLYSNSDIHAFEPLPEHLAELEGNFGKNPNVSIREQALGPQNDDVSINILGSSSSSSIFSPSTVKQEYRERAGKNREKYETRETVNIQQVRLDDKLNHVDIIKLDLQGYELAALKGAEGLLSNSAAILTEVEFIPYYDNQPLFNDIHEYMNEKNFNLYFIYHGYIEPDGRLPTADVLYLNDDIDTIPNK
jgi:FkbM family methyltransferase